LSKLLLNTSLFIILTLTCIDCSCQQTSSQIGLGVGFGFLKEEFNYYYSTTNNRAFRYNRTGFYSLQYLRPEKTIRGSAELYFHSYSIELERSETTNSQYSMNGSRHSYNKWESRYSAQVKRIGLLPAFNFRCNKAGRKLQLYGKFGLGLEHSIQTELIEDYNKSIFSSSSQNSQTGETYSSITVDPNSPSTASEAWDLNLNKTTFIFNPAFRFHWKLNSKFDMCTELGNRFYMNAYPGKIKDHHLVKTIYFGMTAFFKFPSKESIISQ